MCLRPPLAWFCFEKCDIQSERSCIFSKGVGRRLRRNRGRGRKRTNRPWQPPPQGLKLFLILTAGLMRGKQPAEEMWPEALTWPPSAHAKRDKV